MLKKFVKESKYMQRNDISYTRIAEAIDME